MTEATLRPDFLIVGAMKSGTSTLHRILDRHPDLFLPDQEVFFFDIDDFEQHRDFVQPWGERWEFFDYDVNFDSYHEWYRGLFAGAGDTRVLGERSTTYLPSRKAPARIADLLPDARLIVMLRDPVTRAHSHYWHLVRTGRASGTFGEAVRFGSLELLQRGLYREQLERYLDYFPREQILVVLFEEFVRDRQKVLDRVFRFLDVGPLPDESRQPGLKANVARVPRSLRVQLLLSRAFREVTAQRYSRGNLPGRDPEAVGGDLAWSLRRSLLRMNTRRGGRYGVMSQAVKGFLEDYYRRENAGLDDIVGQNFGDWWPYMKRSVPASLLRGSPDPAGSSL